MKRLHLFEFNDLAWFPDTWRNLQTDFLSFYASALRPYARVAPLVAAALERTGTRRLVDLCSGGGGPAVAVKQALEARGDGRVTLTLTDKYPNVSAFRSRAEQAGGGVEGIERPVSAWDVPLELSGFRTLFTAFHHFRPHQARAILADAARKGQGIGVFEYVERNFLIWALPVLCMPLLVWLWTPFIRPFGWRRLLWTYVLPVVPLATWWDGLVSMLRSYSVSELQDLVQSLGETGHQWEIGRVRSVGPSRVTYLIGTFPPTRADG